MINYAFLKIFRDTWINVFGDIPKPNGVIKVEDDVGDIDQVLFKRLVFHVLGITTLLSEQQPQICEEDIASPNILLVRYFLEPNSSHVLLCYFSFRSSLTF